jgi:hypothetical protein
MEDNQQYWQLADLCIKAVIVVVALGSKVLEQSLNYKKSVCQFFFEGVD